MRHCLICEREYKYCPRCGHDQNKPKWMILFESANCHDIDTIIGEYQGKLITKEEAAIRLNNCNLELERYGEKLAELIKDILTALPVEDTKEVEEIQPKKAEVLDTERTYVPVHNTKHSKKKKHN